MMSPQPGLLVALTRAVGRLALPCQDQIEFVRQFGGSLDELALEIGEGVALLEQFVEAGWLSQGDADRLRSIDQALERMSGPANARLWTEASLCQAPEWAEVRAAARRFFHGTGSK
jgi:hypothetical protein